MTAVVLRPLGDARYAVVRNGVDTGALVWSSHFGWVVFVPSSSLRGHEFRRMSEAREWLDSPAGQDWLSSPAAAVPR